MSKYEELHVRYDDPFDIAPMDTGSRTDYVGIGRLYKDDTGQAIRIDDLAELDSNQWMVVGLSLIHI